MQRCSPPLVRWFFHFSISELPIRNARFLLTETKRFLGHGPCPASRQCRFGGRTFFSELRVECSAQGSRRFFHLVTETASANSVSAPHSPRKELQEFTAKPSASPDNCTSSSASSGPSPVLLGPTSGNRKQPPSVPPLPSFITTSDEAGRWMQSPQVLVKQLCLSAQLNVRDELLWRKYIQRVEMMALHMNPSQIVLCFHAFGRIRYRDSRLIDTLSPFVLKFIDQISVCGLVLILNAHKKLEARKYDNLELILNQLCTKSREWTCLDIALTCNALGYFQIYHKQFWSKAFRRLSRFGAGLSGQHISNILGAMARMDLREPEVLLLLAKRVRREVKNLSQELLCITVNSFAKLDFNHSCLSRAFHKHMHIRLDKAAVLPLPQQTLGRQNDTFDLQALVLLAFSSICLTGCSDEMVTKLLRLIAPHVGILGCHKLKKMKAVELTLRLGHPELYGQLDEDVIACLRTIKEAKLHKLGEHGSRWANEVCAVLSDMGITADRRVYADSHCLDILLPDRKVVIKCAGPYSYYTNSNKRTAFSKLQQRHLEAQGFKVIVLPYFEWSELKTVEEKHRYLWSLGRRAAAEIMEQMTEPEAATEVRQSETPYSPESQPAVVSGLSDLSELSDEPEDTVLHDYKACAQHDTSDSPGAHSGVSSAGDKEAAQRRQEEDEDMEFYRAWKARRTRRPTAEQPPAESSVEQQEGVFTEQDYEALLESEED